MGFAHILNLPIYLMYDVPEMIYQSEMAAMDPVIVHGDLTRIPLDAPSRADLARPLEPRS